MARPEVTGKKTTTVTAPAAAAQPPPIRGPPLAMSIREFCALHGISEDMFYKMQREKWGPTVMKVGSRTLISHEAAADWRRARESKPPPKPLECRSPGSPPGLRAFTHHPGRSNSGFLCRDFL